MPETFDFYELVARASWAAKGVLSLLALLSIYSWTLILRKYTLLRRIFRQSEAFRELFRTMSDLNQISKISERYRPSPLVAIFHAGQESLREAEATRSLDLVALERTLRRATLSEMRTLEKGIGELASIATSSPFIGLFGTVIGIILAFHGLSTQAQTSIQAVAPGIAEALVATAVGLFVAIPAYMAYNYFVVRLRALGTLMEEFALEFSEAALRSAAHYGLYRS